MPADETLDAIARGLARGMSRREALRTGGAAFVAAMALSPSDAWAKATGRCPHHRVKCHGKCCPRGEICIHPKRHKKHKHAAKPKCGCPPHTKRHKGKCVHVHTDAHNCGQLGHKCGPGQQCLNGQCVCPAGQSLCGGTCVDTANNPSHCGSCGAICATGTVCIGSTCLNTCPPGTTACNGTCVSTVSDPNNCGSCGHACSAGQVCVNGACAGSCPGGLTACSGSCVDMNIDPSNCGTCGHICPTSQVCSSGTCTGSCPGGTVDCGGGCCAGSACCGSSCQTVHSNGVGQSYYDCNALGQPGNPSTYSLTIATEARAAYPLPGGRDVATTCPDGSHVLVRYDDSRYALWQYDGPLAGHVTVNDAGNGGLCPTLASATWD